MDQINIGFIGGCINTQNGIDRKDLYHTVMANLFKDIDKVNNYRILLASYDMLDELIQQTEKFIKKKKPTIIFLFIRPSSLMPLQKPFIKIDKKEGRKSWILHPCLFNRQLLWESTTAKTNANNEVAIVPKRKIGFKDINLTLGITLGLHHWTLHYVAKQIETIKTICEETQIDLYIISPPKNPESIIGNITCKWVAKYLSDYCRRRMINFLDINHLGFDCFENDNIHLNSQGHKKIGELIYYKLKQHY